MQSNVSKPNAWAKAFAARPGAIVARADGPHAHSDGDGESGPHDHADLSTMLDGHGKRLDDHEGRISALEDGHAGDGSHGGD